MRVFLSILLIVFIFTGAAEAHPIHVSVCNLEFKEKQLLVSVKIFRDDFELAIQNELHRSVDLLSLDGSSDQYNLMDKYIGNNLNIKLNEEPVLLTYISSEINEEAVWVYFSWQLNNPPGIILIQNTLLVDLYHDQTNLVIVNMLGNQNGYRFNYNHREEEIIVK